MECYGFVRGAIIEELRVFSDTRFRGKGTFDVVI